MVIFILWWRINGTSVTILSKIIHIRNYKLKDLSPFQTLQFMRCIAIFTNRAIIQAEESSQFTISRVFLCGCVWGGGRDCFSLRGYCTSYPKKVQNQHIFCSISKLATSIWKITYASYSKLSKELKNYTEIKVGQAVLELWSKTNILAVLIYNLKTAWPTKISMPFLSSLNNFL